VWKYVFLLREGKPTGADEFEAILNENRALQARTVSMLKRLTELPAFSGEVSYYAGMPAFWAYLIDRERLVIGHLALRRLGARNLPVHVIVRGRSEDGVGVQLLRGEHRLDAGIVTADSAAGRVDAQRGAGGPADSPVLRL
jgi:hypothetical protein